MVWYLLCDVDGIECYSDVCGYILKGFSGLEVLVLDSDLVFLDVFSVDDYICILDILEWFYGLVFIDCGIGLLYLVMLVVLFRFDVLVVVSLGFIDGVCSVVVMLDWL